MQQQAEAAFIVDCRARGMRLAAPLQGPVECVQIGGERLRVDTRFKAAADEDEDDADTDVDDDAEEWNAV